MIKSMLAIVAALALLTATTFLIERALELVLPESFIESIAGSLLMMAYITACCVSAGFVAVAISGRLRDTVIAAALQTGFTILAFTQQSATAPVWVWSSILVVTPIAIVLGGRAKDMGGQTAATES